MPTAREPSSAKRLRARVRCIQTLIGPNRQQRRALAKAAVAKFKDELILAGYSPKEMERKLAKWDGDPRTDPLEALINPKREETTLELSEEAKSAGFSGVNREAMPVLVEGRIVGGPSGRDIVYGPAEPEPPKPDPREAEITEAGKRDWLHRFDEAKP